MPPLHYLTADELGSGHRCALFQALDNVLATEVALVTYARIIDGLPLSDVAWDTRGSKLTPQHPINSHVDLCPGALDKAKSFRDHFEPRTLLLQAFESSSLSSRTFDLRLIELVASSVHQIAVLLFQLNLRLHDSATTGNLNVEEVTRWDRPPDEWARVTPHAILFTQSHFVAHNQYPDGIADMIGYCAEDRVLGGVLLFDRSASWKDGKPEPNAYIHCGRANVTFRICQLLDGQQDRLLDFFRTGDKTTVGEPTGDGPLPVLPSSQNRTRIDQRDAITVHHVHRDFWERAPPQQPRLRMQRYMDRCVVSELDYPELNFDEQMERLDKIRSQPSP